MRSSGRVPGQHLRHQRGDLPRRPWSLWSPPARMCCTSASPPPCPPPTSPPASPPGRSWRPTPGPRWPWWTAGPPWARECWYIWRSRRRIRARAWRRSRPSWRQRRTTSTNWFTVDDLNHLKRGGRVSTAAALFGTMLQMKPVLHVDNEGRLIPVSKVRGRKASSRPCWTRWRSWWRTPLWCSSATATAWTTPGAGQVHPGEVPRGEAGHQLRGPRHRQPLRPRYPGAVLRGEREVVFPLRGLRPHTLGISGASPPDPDLLFPRGKSRQKHTQEGDTFDCVPLLGTSPPPTTQRGASAPLWISPSQSCGLSGDPYQFYLRDGNESRLAPRFSPLAKTLVRRTPGENPNETCPPFTGGSRSIVDHQAAD